MCIQRARMDGGGGYISLIDAPYNKLMLVTDRFYSIHD